MLYVFETLTVPETTTNMLLSLDNGVGVIDIASITLYSGFLEGKWSPDVMMLLMEPTMYMIMALAEKAEIEYQLEAGDDEVPSEIDADQHIAKLQGGLNQLDELKRQAVDRVSPQSVPEDVREVIEETTLSPSLLERVQQESQNSLLAREK